MPWTAKDQEIYDECVAHGGPCPYCVYQKKTRDTTKEE